MARRIGFRVVVAASAFSAKVFVQSGGFPFSEISTFTVASLEMIQALRIAVAGCVFGTRNKVLPVIRGGLPFVR
eukprot:scaffold13478_cov132-Cylindrotheca_fusiformis.AAC.10